MNTVATPTLRSPQDILEAIPCLLGFHPDDSVVAIVIKQGLIYATARWDIEAVEQPCGADWIHARMSQCCDGDDVTVFLAGYGQRQRVARSLNLVRDTLDVQVVDAFVVQDGWWWFLDEAGDEPGTALNAPGWVARRLMKKEKAVAANRQALSMSIAAPMGDREDEILSVVIDAIDLVDEDCDKAGQWVVDLMGEFTKGKDISDTEFLAAGFAMSVGRTRDGVWEVLTRDKAGEFLPFWKEQLRRCPEGMRTVSLAVTGMIAWVAGEGALMNICLEEAEQCEPDYPLVTMLEQISQGCVSPQLWEDAAVPKATG